MPETTQGDIKPREVTSGARHMVSRLRSYFLWTPLIWFYTIVLGCVSLVVSFFDPSGERQQKVARLWSQMILGTVGAKVQVEGLDRIDTSKPQVYVVNHLSAFDIPVLYSYLPFQFRILAKKELFRYPFMGWHLRRSGQIPVVLENPKASVRSLNLAVAAIRKGNSLVIFPEGGRSPDGQLHSFMGGAFYAAVKAQVDVVPVALVGTYEMLKMNTFHIKPGRVKMVVGSPISTVGMSTRDIAKITERARVAIGELYYSRCVVPDLRGEQLETKEPTKL
ncbi:MAG TPA: lysophospholipid acyltransferase family protein [Candidatus Dormibacteraeota bacterium]|nr:lysophospholipid acyltransferase family protein [Candidatus Dormibacteraeota bacterium]